MVPFTVILFFKYFKKQLQYPISTLFFVKGYDWKGSFWLSNQLIFFPIFLRGCWGLGCPQWCQSIKKHLNMLTIQQSREQKKCMHSTMNLIHSKVMPTWKIKRTQWDFSAKDLHEPSLHVCQVFDVFHVQLCRETIKLASTH